MKDMTDQYTHEPSDYGNLIGYCRAGMLNSTVQCLNLSTTQESYFGSWGILCSILIPLTSLNI